MPDNSNISGWASAAKALACSPSKLRRLVADGPLVVPKDAKGVCQFTPAIIAQLRDALEHGWPDQPGAQADAAAPMDKRPTMATPAGETAIAAHVPARTPGAMAAWAFQLLDDGAAPTELVKTLEIPPADAMQLYDAWKAAKIADQDAAELRAVLELRQDLKVWGWTCADVVQAYQAVHEAGELYGDAGFTSDAAMALLRVVRDRGWSFTEAMEALRAQPGLEEQERRVAAAEAEAQGAQQALERIQGVLQELLPYLGWLRLSRALAALVEGGADAVAELRSALAVVPPGNTADQMMVNVKPEDEALARRLLAAWATVELRDLVVLRSEHEGRRLSFEDVMVMKMLQAGM